MLFLVRAVRAVEDDCVVLPTGQQDCVVERIAAKPPGKLWNAGKLVFVCLICLAGGAFSIMAFHNDIGIVDLFAQIYTQVIGYEPEQIGGLEIGYSFGLALGILIFFNHISLQKREKDPTPLQVEVSKYEQDVEDTIQRIKEKEQQKRQEHRQDASSKETGGNSNKDMGEKQE